MLLILLLSATITTSFTLCLATNPLTLGLNILFIALFLTIVFATSIRNWFAFLIFLIYVRGILVIFAYFAAIAPNQVIPSASIFMAWLVSFIIIFSLLILSSSPTLLPAYYSKIMSKLYLSQSIPLLLMLATILLLIIIVVVKLTSRNKGPLRPFSKYV